MKRIKDLFAVYVVATLVVAGFGIQVQAQRRSEKQVRDTVRSLASKIDDFQYSLKNQLRTNSTDRQDIDDVGTSLRNLQGKVSDFESNLDQKRENRDDVQAIITAAQDVDAFLSQNRQSGRLETSWEGVRGQINRLASQYGVTPDWSRRVSSYPDKQPNYPPQMSTPSSYNSGLAGTYELDAARSENISDIISNSGVGSGQRQDLESKLEAPEQIALDVRRNQVTLATSKAAPITFTADGREKTENSGGRTVRLKATMNGQQLTVSSLGGQTDYTITFVSSNNGNTLKVTRRITTDYLRETIFAESVYNKTDQV
ncbi:MAG TPA: hypothetical protein VHL50_06735, partial [Pyrinomonadaceae bacterium]|nr:hypothetical protein [Pyrinomonadaceae bacterium]